MFADDELIPAGTLPLVQPQPHITAILNAPAPLQRQEIMPLINGSPSTEVSLAGNEDGTVWTLDFGDVWGPGEHAIGATLTHGESSFSLDAGFLTPSTELQLQDVYFYPNPLTASGAAAQQDGVLIYHATNVPQDVEISIYSASGRRVLRDRGTKLAGANYFTWNGVDGLGDPVANGVYLVVIKMTGHNGEEFQQKERVVISR